MKNLFALISELLLFRVGGANKNVRLRFTHHEDKNIVESFFFIFLQAIKVSVEMEEKCWAKSNFSVQK